MAMSAVDIVGGLTLPATWAAGTQKPSLTSRGCHCLAPAGDSTSSHSWAKIVSRYMLSHWVGVGVHAPSRPDVIVYSPKPVSWLLDQPIPCAIRPALSGSGPTTSGATAPCILPNVWPP